MRRSRIAVALIAWAACAGPPDAAEDAYPSTRLRLLTDAQHANAIRDLVGDVELPEVRTPGITADQLVHEVELTSIGGPLLSQYHAAARAAAAQAAGELSSCPAPSGGEACALELIDRLAPRAFRRPIDGGDRDRLLEIYRAGSPDGHDAGVELVLEAILSAPDFLYRKELGAPGDPGVVDLTPHEIAAQLSFLFLDSIPDPPLWAAAVDGSLADPAVIAAHIDRLLEQPRVRAHLEEVVLTWLRIPAVERLDLYSLPDLPAELRDSMVAETRRFVADVLWRRGGSLAELLTSTRTFVDGRLAAHYGVAGIEGDDLVEVDLDPGRRAGVLTQAGILTLLSTAAARSIVQRGLFVNRLFVCYPEPPPPPLELLAEAREVDMIDELDERELADYRAARADCAGCHHRVDPLGIALERYDKLGRWRDEAEATAAVTLGDRATEITGAVELARLLADSDEVAACVVDQYLQHAFGGPLVDAPQTRAAVLARFATTGLDLVEVFRAIAGSPAFRKRWRPAL
jgi:hypothetical protein